jgi:integration host factor subunit beta
MNKAQLIHAVQVGELPKKEVGTAITEIFEFWKKKISEGDTIELRNFCTFKTRHYKSYRGRNPATGEPVVVKAKNRPVFKLGRSLTQRLNER